MRIIISPAKKMRVDTDSYEVLGKPEFLEQAEILRKEIKKLTLEEARELWNCNFKLARLNYDRFQNMELTKALTPAIMAYEGLQYQHMAQGEMVRFMAENGVVSPEEIKKFSRLGYCFSERMSSEWEYVFVRNPLPASLNTTENTSREVWNL